jgi:hypothetical protein
MTTDQLEQRLQNLTVDPPDAGRVTAGVLSRRAAPRLAIPRAFTVTVAAVVLVAATIYFVPAADLAIASVPVAGDMLNDAGLVGARDRITYVNASSSSSGYTLTLVGVYADSARTVLLMHSAPVIGFPSRLVQLTDQFGRTYDWQNGSSNSQTGELVMQFGPLAWPDAITGARITLHISSVQITDPATGPLYEVAGSWTLTAAITVDQGSALPVPAPASLGPAHFRFTSASYTPATVALEVEVTGVTFTELGRIIPDGGKGTPAFTMDLIDPQGEIVSGSSDESSDVIGVVHIHFLGFRSGAGGEYTLRVSYYGEGEFERVLTIP